MSERPKHRMWKLVIEQNYDPMNPPEYRRDNLVEKQKKWLINAWENYFGYVPNAVPCYSEDKGFFHVPCIKINWHHIVPIGESIRLDGLGEARYNNPKNIVPVEELNHIGKHADADDFIIHEDTSDAYKNYVLYKNGLINEDPFSTMNKERVWYTNNGLMYHSDELDSYFTNLADVVVGNYLNDKRIKWPEVKRK